MLPVLWLVILTIASHKATYLSDIMDNHLDGSGLLNGQNDEILHLAPGVFFLLLDYPVISTTLKMEGTPSTISPPDNDRLKVSFERENHHPQHLNHFVKAHMDTSHSLFLFDNSTVSLKKMILDCGNDGMALAKVTSSSVVVSWSKIISNSKQTAFVVGTGLEVFGSSISVIDCSHISSASVVLLPLVSTCTCLPTPQRDSSSTDTPHSDPISPFLSVSGVGLVLSNRELYLGTGPLLEFGMLNKPLNRSEDVGGGETSTALVGSVLLNMSSFGNKIEDLILPTSLSQKLVGTEITACPSHLSGSWCLDVSVFGSVGCVNTSFSHYSSDAGLSSFQYSRSIERFREDTHYNSPSTQTTLTFRLCTFTDMTSDSAGACLCVYAPYPTVTISECSFHTISGDSGGVLLVHSLRRGEGSMTISLCSFVSCFSGSWEGVLCHLNSSLLAIDRCFFKNVTTAAPWFAEGGAVRVSSTTTTSITECVFMECSATHEFGRGGAVSILDSSLRMASVQFIGNSAPNGSDVYLSAGCGTPSEVKERVSDCHTDKPDTSVKFEDFGVQTGIIDEFGTTTIITSLQLAMSPTASEGTIEVETQHPVQGTMILLLGSSDACSPLSDGSPHATCRVVVVSFPTLSTTGTSDVLSFGENENLQSQCTYSLIAASISATVIDVASPSSFFAGDPARVRRFKCEQGANIGEMLVWLEGRQLAAGEYTVSFEGNRSISLVFSFADGDNGLPTQISSSVSVGPGGIDKRFSFGETYKVDTITFNNNPVITETVGFSLAIPPFPTPCVSFDSAIETTSKMGMKSIELKLAISETFSNTLSISDENELSVTQKDVSPSLIVPSTFSSNPLVVISVSNASLSLTDVDALIHCSSLDLKLVRVSSGFFVFDKGSITYTPSSTTNANTRISNSDLCSWTTGVIELVNSTSDISFCSFTNLKQGAILQRGGFLYLQSVFFLSDEPINDDFPSARRNVICSEDGMLMIGKKPTSKLRLIHVVIVVVVVLAGMVLALLLIWKCHSKKPAEKTKEKIDTPNETHPTIITQAASDQSEHESAAEQAVQNQTDPTRRFSEDSEEDGWIHNRSAAPVCAPLNDQESLSRQEPATADQLACGYIGTGREQAVGFLYLPEFLIGRDNGIVASPTPLFLLNAVNPPFMSSEFHPVPPAAVPKVASIDVGTPMVRFCDFGRDGVLEEIADSKTDIPTTVNDTVSQLIK
ncbi:hypothetical protein BLNAU_24220 [Blattamonas nauphoetae]|uniref:Uncharacterized protein n=1 Tax=Blattamonas nauphoetae TaxID=2049346 RepID=A0ABQ9WN17_9EUKA|nr:hypothetical protein BLNAU_24220 [Blattamonas nauphoetae]